MPVTKHLRIFGRVQGVWFRESMRQEAERVGITGWVRNRLDGSVEAMIQGEPDSVERLVEWAWHGPDQAQVSSVQVQEGEGTFPRFEKRGSA